MLNRRIACLLLFEKPADDIAFEKIVAEAVAAIRIRIAVYSLVSNTGICYCDPAARGSSPRCSARCSGGSP